MLLSITTRIVTDSNAMLPRDLVSRFGILEVPLTVVIDGVAHHEHRVVLADFYDGLRAGGSVSTAAPSPGEILATYREAVADGADSIVSIHVGSNQSGTVNAARLAAGEVTAPVTIVDTGTASFILGCCVWRAAETLATGAGVADSVRAAETVAGGAGSVFTIGEIARAAGGGRIAVAEGPGVPVFASEGPDMYEIDRVTSEAAAVEAMVTEVAKHPGVLRVGVGHADAPGPAGTLEDALRSLPQVTEIVRYVVGPSVAAHTGAGTFGAVFHPI
jgi:DegV family protein with EDD domain